MTTHTRKETAMPKKPVKITTTARDLRDLLTPVLPFTDKGDTLPVLETILLRGHGDQLSATATDRYRIGMTRAKIAAPKTFEALLPWRSAKAILAMFKVTRARNPELTLTFDFAEQVVRVETAGLSEDIAGARIGYRLLQAEYPKKVDSIFADAFSGGSVEPFALNAHFLADFQHVVRDAEPLVLSRSKRENGPIGVACGDWFVGAIMPVRSTAKREDLPVVWKGIVDFTAKDPRDVAAEKADNAAKAGAA